MLLEEVILTFYKRFLISDRSQFVKVLFVKKKQK